MTEATVRYGDAHPPAVHDERDLRRARILDVPLDNDHRRIVGTEAVAVGGRADGDSRRKAFGEVLSAKHLVRLCAPGVGGADARLLRPGRSTDGR